MARTILITIQDNEAAELFARQMLASPEPPDYLAGLVEVPEGATIDAMVARPTKYCRCTPTQLRQGRHGPKIVRNWTRTPRFGWFVCSRCKRPSRARSLLPASEPAASLTFPATFPTRPPVVRSELS